jgi:hypothetical protein
LNKYEDWEDATPDTRIAVNSEDFW